MTHIEPIESQRQTLTIGQVVEYLNTPGNVAWIKAGELLGKENDACVDGRETDLVIASPGGDIVLLTEAIISLGKFANKQLNPVDINKVFRWRLTSHGSTYMHTDEHALKNLGKSIAGDDRFQRLSLSSPQEVFRFVLNPDSRYQLSLLDHLLVPDNIGCGHLKLMLKNPEAYGMSRKVINALIHSFFDTLWNGAPKEKANINYNYLKGNHNEGAVVTIQVPEKEVNQDTWIPKVRPTDGQVSMFVFHPQASRFMHRVEAVGLAESGLFPWLTRDQVKTYSQTMTDVLGEGLRETVSHLALDLPKYTFELRKD